MEDSSIEELRDRIKDVDIHLMELISERMNLSQTIGNIKADQNMPIVNSEVEKKVVERYRSIAESNNVDPEFAEALSRLIMEESVRIQKSL